MGYLKSLEEKKPPSKRVAAQESGLHLEASVIQCANNLKGLRQVIGNRAFQRLLVQQYTDDGTSDLDDETAARISRERSGGQALDASLQRQAGETVGYDLSRVRVHTSPEADALNRGLNAKAFTTGQDIFFREGAYDPHSSAGQELITHELTHVVQQSTGAVGSGSGKMTVNAPGDAFEQEADAVAKAVVSAGPQVQRQAAEEQALQRQELEEEEEEQALQRQELDEEEEENLVQ
jgi:hypothetical protein